jgi:hypothetical protein
MQQSAYWFRLLNNNDPSLIITLSYICVNLKYTGHSNRAKEQNCLINEKSEFHT